MTRVMLTLALWACGVGWALAADNERQAADEAAIRAAVESYVAAYNRGDAKALAALWSPDAVYSVPESDEQVVGREAIEQQFATVLGGDDGARLAASTNAIQFVSPNVAVEHGTARVVRSEGPAEESAYTAVYVRRDGEWLLDRVSEEGSLGPSANYEQLRPLEWMIGTWVDEDDRSRIETTCEWAKNRSFMTRSFTLSVRDQIELAGMQIVGWDPAKEEIRSWVFDSDGGFGEGSWTKKGDAWHIKVVGTAPDGSLSSSLNIITRINDDRFTWQSIDRVSGGELLPNVDEVVVARAPAESEGQ